MKRRILTAAIGLLAVGTALADVMMEGLSYGGAYTVDMTTGSTIAGDGGGTRYVGDIYSNTASPANTGVSSTSLTNIWGDECNAIDVGLLDQFQLSIFNSASGNTLPINTLDVSVTLRRPDLSLMGGFSGTINFGAGGLAPGFYSLVTFTGLSGLGINIDSTAMRVEQQRTAHTGGSTRMGIASLVPVTIGSSPDSYLLNGAVSSLSVPIQVAYRVGVIPEPASILLLGLGVALLRRR